MRIRTKNKIDYGNIIKDDIKISYKKRNSKNKNKRKKIIKSLLDNQNFRNNQNYILSKDIISDFLSKNRLKLILKYFGLIFFVIFLELTIFTNNLFYILGFFIIFFIFYKKTFSKDKLIFHIKEKYFNKHFIYTADKKNDKIKL